MDFVSEINVNYGNQPSLAPVGRIPELNKESDNLNDGFGGSYVWLVPSRTSDRSAGLVSLSIIVQKNPDPTLRNLAQGAGGDYRYLNPIPDSSQTSRRITEVVLFRSETELLETPAGWNGNSGNINQGRSSTTAGKTFLYILWKTA